MLSGDIRRLRQGLDALNEGAEEAAQFQALLGTMQGLGLLDGINDTDLAAVARAARVGRDGHDVTLALALPANTAARLAAHAGPAAQ